MSGSSSRRNKGTYPTHHARTPGLVHLSGLDLNSDLALDEYTFTTTKKVIEMATTWFSKRLGDGVDAHGPSTRILDAFMPVYIASGQPPNMAVFSRYDMKENVVTVYFTPEAANLALTHGASPCEKPSSEDIGLLAGDQTAWQTHFPDRVAGRRRISE